MIKYLKFILIVCPLILALLLGINIYKCINLNNKNKEITKSTNDYVLKINNNTNSIKGKEKELKKLSEDTKDKIEEYEKWIKWNKEIKEIIN